MPAGYSGTSLIKKLGIKEEMKVWLIDIPKEYFTLLEKDLSSQLCEKKEAPDLVHVFVASRRMFESHMKIIKQRMKPTTIIWVSWYKKSAGIPKDITEDVIRGYALHNDLVDVKVCAVSDVWSGLKLVVPRVKR